MKVKDKTFRGDRFLKIYSIHQANDPHKVITLLRINFIFFQVLDQQMFLLKNKIKVTKFTCFSNHFRKISHGFLFFQ